jgi:heptosyltransferase I
VRRELAGRRFDVCIDLQVYFKAGVITSFVRAPFKLGFDRARARDFNWLFTNAKVPPRPMQHVQDQYFEFLDALGVPHRPPVWDLGPWPDERAWQREFFAPLDRPAAAVVVATSKAQKDWAPERWARVCDALYGDYGLQPVLRWAGGPSPSAKRSPPRASCCARRARAPFWSRYSLRQRACGARRQSGARARRRAPSWLDDRPLHVFQRSRSTATGGDPHRLCQPARSGPYRRIGDLMIAAYGRPGPRTTGARWRPPRAACRA